MLFGKSRVLFQPVVEWFGQQTEAVKLALIALVSAFGAGVFGVIKEGRKPVLANSAPAAATSAGAPRSADDPLILLTNSIEGLAFQFSEMKVAIDRLDRNDRRILDELKELETSVESVLRELIILRELRHTIAGD